MKTSRSFKRPQKTLLALAMVVLLGLIHMTAVAGDRYVDNGDGTVTDTQTGLMWAAKDSGSLINWKNARNYCQSFNGGGHTDWRMPTLAELASLYDPEATNKSGYHMTKYIDTSAETCWACETRGLESARFNFTHGHEFWLRQSYSGRSSVLPVRDSK